MKAAVYLAIGLSAATTAQACRHEQPFEETLPAGSINELQVSTSSGNVIITGGDGDQIVIRGNACVRKDWMLDEIDLQVTREGRRVVVRGIVPDPASKEWKMKDRLDLWIDVPRGITVAVTDEDGDIEITGVGPTTINDRGGHLTLSDIDGDLSIEDHSGNVFIDRVTGSLDATDGSGRMIIGDVEGDVHIAADTSGNIEIDRVGGTVRIDEDASGHIEVRGAEGDVLIGDDTTGDIEVQGVGGDFRVGSNEKGKIKHEDVAGEVSVPPPD